MTRTISIITATVGAALLFAIPAYGDNWAADKSQPSTPSTSPDWFERAAAAAIEKQKVEMLNAREQSLGAGVGNGKFSAIDAREQAFGTKQVLQPAPDWFERAADAAIRNSRVPFVDDRFTIDPTSGQDPVTVSSGREIELPQVGIGFGIGLLLALGLYLTLRYTRGRELAH
jgi:hypothetical protein